MVIYLLKYDVVPGKKEEWAQWAQVVIPKLLAVPGIVEFSSYRPRTGSQTVAIMCKFASLEDWAKWVSSQVVKDIFDESWRYQTNQTLELWDASPVVPEPLYPPN